MVTENNSEKLEQFNEFFTISHTFNINIKSLAPEAIHDYQHFVEHMPPAFKMVSDMTTLDQAALNPLQALSGVAGQLVEYLNHQAQKIDILMTYIMSQQDEPESRYQGISFGGGGITFTSHQSLALNDMIELKIFIQNDNCAVYCFGEIIDITQQADAFIHKVIFHFIRDEDREILVRASLHRQTKQLQQLAKQRQQASANKNK